MTLHDDVGYETGLYTVLRTVEGAYVVGHYVRPAGTGFPVSMSIQPITGRALKDLPEGQHAEDLRIAYTSTRLFTREPGFEPDIVTINGEDWRVSNVEHFEVISGHYRATLERLVTP